MQVTRGIYLDSRIQILESFRKSVRILTFFSSYTFDSYLFSYQKKTYKKTKKLIYASERDAWIFSNSRVFIVLNL